MSQNIRLIILILSFLICSGCVTYIGYEAAYEGRIIDKDTNKPIGGTVVHGTWYKALPVSGGATLTYYDSKEVLTDEDGRFKIEGLGLVMGSKMEEMSVCVLKSGYREFNLNWVGFRNNSSEFELVDGKPVIKLRRLTMDERNNRAIVGPVSVPSNKMQLFNTERNKENMEIGRQSSLLFPVE